MDDADQKKRGYCLSGPSSSKTTPPLRAGTFDLYIYHVIGRVQEQQVKLKIGKARGGREETLVWRTVGMKRPFGS